MKNVFNCCVFFLLLFFSASCAAADPLAGAGGQQEPAAPAAPTPTQPVSAFVPTQALMLPTSQPTQIPIPPAIQESRRLTLEFPTQIRAGVEGDTARLTLEVDELGNITPTAEFEGHTVIGETLEIPDLYETHYVTAEARFDMAGMDIQPSGTTYEPLKRGQPATFYWSISPRDVGTYRGTVWLHLGFENRLTGEKDRVAVSAQIIEIKAADFFGMSFSVARAGGVVGSIVSAVIGFPFLEDMLKWLFRKKKSGKARR